VLPGAPKVLSGTSRHSQTCHNHSHSSHVPVIRDRSYSKGLPECPPRVWYSLEIDPSKFTLHIHADTPGVFRWLKYILLMWWEIDFRTTTASTWYISRFSQLASLGAPSITLVYHLQQNWLRVYIPQNFDKHAILWCSKSCDCNKEEYTQITTGLRLWHQVSRRFVQRSQLLSKSPTDIQSGLNSSKSWLFYDSNLVASWIHLQNCRCFQDHQNVLLQSLKPLCLAPVGPGCTWKYIEALVRSTAVSGRFACGFRTYLHFAAIVPPIKYSMDYWLKISFSMSYAPHKVIFPCVEETWNPL